MLHRDLGRSSVAWGLVLTRAFALVVLSLIVTNATTPIIETQPNSSAAAAFSQVTNLTPAPRPKSTTEFLARTRSGFEGLTVAEESELVIRAVVLVSVVNRATTLTHEQKESLIFQSVEQLFSIVKMRTVSGATKVKINEYAIAAIETVASDNELPGEVQMALAGFVQRETAQVMASVAAAEMAEYAAIDSMKTLPHRIKRLIEELKRVTPRNYPHPDP